MTEKEDIHKNKLPNKTYISPRIDSGGGSKVRIASKVMDGETLAYAVEKGEVVLRRTPTRRKEIIAKFLEDDRGLTVITIQSFNGVKGTPHPTYFSFVGQEIPNLLRFFQDISTVQFESESKVNLTDSELRKLIVSKEQAASLVHENQDLFNEVLRSGLTKNDAVAMGYRRRQATTFGRLLNDRAYFDQVKAAKQCRGDEHLWQMFFEKNEWIFGYGLSYVYVSGFEQRRLEQFVQGYDLVNKGKRADAVMRSRGIVSSLCFVEIKTHETPLLTKEPYRSGCWAPSKELAGAIAQIQGTVASALRNLSGRIHLTTADGDPAGQEVFNFKPRAFLVIGSLDQLVVANGVNEEKLRSFELFRNSIEGIEILTFDELYARSTFLTQSSEGA